MCTCGHAVGSRLRNNKNNNFANHKRHHAAPFTSGNRNRRGQQMNEKSSRDLVRPPIALDLALRGFAVRRYCAGTRLSLLRGPLRCRLPPFRHVHAKPRHEARKSAQGEQDWEGIPVVSTLVDYRLDHIWSNNCRGAIR